MSTVTAPNGYTPQGQQLAAGQPNGSNIQAPPPSAGLSDYPSDQALNSAFTTANANSVTANSQGARQADVNGAGIPAAQANYDDLAKQLFQYDQANLAPQFQGQSNGIPADAAAFGRVDASPLAMTETGGGQVNPKFGYGLQDTQAKSLLTLLSALNSGIGSRLGTAKDKSGADVTAAQAALDNILKIMGIKSNLVTQAAQNKNELDKTALTLGYANMDKNGNITYSNQDAGDASKAIDMGDRKAVQAAANKYGTSNPLYKKIADAWKSAHGSNLFPAPVQGTDRGVLDSTQQALKLINEAQAILKRNPKAVGGPGGIINDVLASNKKTYAMVNKDAFRLNEIMLQLRTLGEKKAVGGRLTGYLINVLAPSYPGLTKSAEQNLTDFQTMRDSGMQDLQDLASNHSYDKITDIPSVDKNTIHNRQAMVDSLKAKGYNDDKIHAYLKAKGID